jgi:ATPase subunit of ABC transporter with duplicated ATPase domains
LHILVLSTLERILYMSTHHSIQLKDISLKFEDKTVFTHINATINANDRIAIIGPNGAGKSSLMRTIAG